MSYVLLVEEFHCAFLYRYPSPIAPDLLDADTNQLRINLLIEELTELKQAITDNNRVEMLDALCDFQYVLSGAVLALGFKLLFREEKDMYFSIMAENATEVYIAFLDEKIARLAQLLDGGNVVGTLETLQMLQHLLKRLIDALGFAEVFTKAFTEVHRSNMSKQWSDAEVESATGQTVHQSGVLSSLTGMDAESRYSFTRSGDKWIAKRADSKIIKSPSYSPANLTPFCARTEA